MGFNRRKMEAERKAKADAEAAARRATDAQVLQDAERLIGAWNERQSRRMPLLFAPTIGAALAARHHFLWPFVRPVAPLGTLTCARSTGAAMPRSRAWPVAVLPLLPASCTVRSARAAVQNQHC